MVDLPLYSKDGKSAGTVKVNEKLFGELVRKKELAHRLAHESFLATPQPELQMALRAFEHHLVAPPEEVLRLRALRERKYREPREREQQGGAHGPKDTRRSRKEFKITETELRLIAALASIGSRVSPNGTYSAPAAIGTPSAL